MDVPTFRAQFPEFGNENKYPFSQVNYWLGIGCLLLNSQRWGNLLDHGTALFIAHNVVLEAQAMATSALANRISNPALAPVPGLSTGPTSAKGVDKVSVAYDTTAGIEEKAGHWNLTVYGTRFIKLARMVGAGPVQINGCNTWSGGTLLGIPF